MAQNAKIRAGKRERENATPATLEWGGFVALSLSDESQTQCALWCDNEFSLDTAMDWVAEVGLFGKVSLSVDPKSDSFIASLTLQRPNNRSASGRCLTAWGISPTEALAALMFKDLVLLEQRWDEQAPNAVTMKRRFG